MVDLRRQAVSFRLAHGDIRNIKRFAKRLGVRDSDIVRFAIRSTFSRLAPLCDPAIRGRSLIPVLAEAGDELIRHFELDAFQLDAIVNDEVDPKDRVERDDIVLLAMLNLRQDYMRMRLNEESQTGNDQSGDSLRRYLYDKYVYGDGGPHPAAAASESGEEAEHVNGTSPEAAPSI